MNTSSDTYIDDMINVCAQLKSNPSKVAEYKKAIERNHNLSDEPEAFYARMLNRFSNSIHRDTPEQAARFLYLNS